MMEHSVRGSEQPDVFKEALEALHSHTRTSGSQPTVFFVDDVSERERMNTNMHEKWCPSPNQCVCYVFAPDVHLVLEEKGPSLSTAQQANIKKLLLTICPPDRV